MELREPKKKRVPAHLKIHQPFPILIESETGIPSHRSLWPLYTGIFNGDCVIVCNPDEMGALYNMGFFGKGSFSRGYPTFGLTQKGVPPFIYGRQWNRRKKWIEKLAHNGKKYPETIQALNNKGEVNIEKTKLNDRRKEEPVCDGSSNKNTTLSKDSSETMDIVVESEKSNHPAKNHGMNKLSENMTSDDDSQNIESNYSYDVIVIKDSDSDEDDILINPKVTIESESIKTVQESLNLSLEEAFFLSFALGCFHVYDWNGQFLSLTKMWQTFREAQADFVENYVAYHYFRAKGWIVKPGYKFGGDLLLYKQGPPFYHASYVVVVESVQEGHRKRENLSWNKLQGINRIAETARKEVLICQVFWPSLLEDEELNVPLVLPRFEVKEVLLRRWISSQEREDKE